MEQIEDARWQEICKWVNEWDGGGWTTPGGGSVLFQAARAGSMALEFRSFKPSSQEPRFLVYISVDPGPLGTEARIILEKDMTAPDTLNEFLDFYESYYTSGSKFQSWARLATKKNIADEIKRVRRTVKAIRDNQGYARLAEVYEYVIGRLRTPTEHHELHTDTSEYGEAVGWRPGKPSPQSGLPFDEREAQRAEEWARGEYPDIFRVDSDRFSALRYVFTFRDKTEAAGTRFSFAFCTDPTNYGPNLTNLPREKWIFLLLSCNKLGLLQSIPVRDRFPDTLEEALQSLKNPQSADAIKGFSFYPLACQAYDGMLRHLFPGIEHHELHTDVEGYDESLSFAEAVGETVDWTEVPWQRIEALYRGWLEASSENGRKGLQKARHLIEIYKIFGGTTRDSVLVEIAVDGEEIQLMVSAEDWTRYWSANSDSITLDLDRFLVEHPEEGSAQNNFSDVVRERIRETWEAFWGPLRAVEHHELHTDVSGYDESLMFESINLRSLNNEDFRAARKKWSEIIPRDLDASEFLEDTHDECFAFGLYEEGGDAAAAVLVSKIDLSDIGGPPPSWFVCYEKFDGSVYQGVTVYPDNAPENGEALNLFGVGKLEIRPKIRAVYDRFIRLFAPVEHHELHTDTSGYDEGLALTIHKDREALACLIPVSEANVAVPEGEETLNLKEVPEYEVKAAYDAWEARGGDNVGFGYKPGQYAIFGRNHDSGSGENRIALDVTITIALEIELSVIISGDDEFQVSVAAFETPVNPEPLFSNLYRQIQDPHFEFEINAEEIKEPLWRAIEGTWRDWIALFKPVEHHELHTDTSGYDEAIGYSGGYGRPPRKKTLYDPATSGKGHLGLVPERDKGEDYDRPDYQSVCFKFSGADAEGEKTWQIKIGKATIYGPKVRYSVKVYAKGVAKNPYDPGQGVQELIGPPFYALGINLQITPGRGDTIQALVRRHFDAGGYLCWVEANRFGSPGWNPHAPETFCPMGDLKAMEERTFGGVDPTNEGYFFAISQGSVTDQIGRDEKMVNLWKIFLPYIAELAKHPEVLALEKMFKATEHHELHTDPDEPYDEAVSRTVGKDFLLYDEAAAYEPVYDLSWITKKDLPVLKAELERAGFNTGLSPMRDLLEVTDTLTLGPGQHLVYFFYLTVEKKVSIQYGFYEERWRTFPGETYNLGVVPAELPDWFTGNATVPPQYRNRSYDTLNRIYRKWINVLRPVPEHHELHTDVGGYDESQ